MIEYYEITDSTNIRCINLGESGAEEFSVVVSARQTSGRGRKGRTWSSEGRDGLYFSVLLRPNMDMDSVSMVTLVMAYSICRLLRCRCIDAGIKWPNDIVVNGRKICGILTELHMDHLTGQEEHLAGQEAGKHYFVVIGAGINVNNSKFDEELMNRATSIYMETGEVWPMDYENDRITIVTEILEYFRKDWQRVVEAGNLMPIRREYEKLLVNKGAVVRIMDPGREYEAKALGISDRGALIVSHDDGTVSEVAAGEVSVRGIMGYV